MLVQSIQPVLQLLLKPWLSDEDTFCILTLSIDTLGQGTDFCDNVHMGHLKYDVKCDVQYGGDFYVKGEA